MKFSSGSAGGLSYTQPAVTAAASYYKIMQGNPITFGWTFTSLVYVPSRPTHTRRIDFELVYRVQPTSLTFLAYCAANSRTYPVGPATGIPGAATQLIWDPYAFVRDYSDQSLDLMVVLRIDMSKRQAHQHSLKLRIRYEYSTNEDRLLSLLLGDSPARMPSSSLPCTLQHRIPLSPQASHSQNPVTRIKLIDS